MPGAEEVTPAHVRQRPAWVTELQQFAHGNILKTTHGIAEKLKSMKQPGATLQIPLWMLKLDRFSIFVGHLLPVVACVVSSLSNPYLVHIHDIHLPITPRKSPYVVDHHHESVQCLPESS